MCVPKILYTQQPHIVWGRRGSAVHVVWRGGAQQFTWSGEAGLCNPTLSGGGGAQPSTWSGEAGLCSPAGLGDAGPTEPVRLFFPH